MGYACPVCETPQADAGHLANHIAFTAMLGDDDHETWLDDHAPGWSERGERDLADRVVEHASEVEFPQVFEDTTEDHDGHDHDEPRPGALFEDDRGLAERAERGGTVERDTRGGADAPSDPEVAEAMAEARELTRQRRGDTEEDGDDHENGGDGHETEEDGNTDEYAARDDADPADEAESQ